MNQCEWIVCERRPRWTAALRTAIVREGIRGERLPRLVEVRTLGELTTRLEARARSFVLVEVDRDRLGDVLGWLSDTATRFPESRTAAALSGDLAGAAETAAVGGLGSTCRLACDALAEAGAAEITDSPRRLHGVLELARRHAECLLDAGSGWPNVPIESLSLRSAVWASLPWQAE